VYVETDDGETVVGGETEEPEEVDPSAAPGLDETRRAPNGSGGGAAEYPKPPPTFIRRQRDSPT